MLRVRAVEYIVAIFGLLVSYMILSLIISSSILEVSRKADLLKAV